MAAVAMVNGQAKSMAAPTDCPPAPLPAGQAKIIVYCNHQNACLARGTIVGKFIETKKYLIIFLFHSSDMHLFCTRRINSVLSISVHSLLYSS